MEPFPPITLNHLWNKQTKSNNDNSTVFVFFLQADTDERELDSSVSDWVICLVTIGNH